MTNIVSALLHLQETNRARNLVQINMNQKGFELVLGEDEIPVTVLDGEESGEMSYENELADRISANHILG